MKRSLEDCFFHVRTVLYVDDEGESKFALGCFSEAPSESLLNTTET